MIEPTGDEIAYLMNELPDDNRENYMDVGQSCFENGWIDVFGFVTPQGQKVLEIYRAEQG